MILYARIPRQYLVDANYNELTPDKWELFETHEPLVVNAWHRSSGRWFTVRAEFVESDGWTMAKLPASLADGLRETTFVTPAELNATLRGDVKEPQDAATSSAEGQAPRRGRKAKAPTDGV